ncbi:family 16 glycosylhydrolase [Caulobacter sp. S45]|uniref:glycoside hydrolase family 16 protein n=1 Tax=Caulobacter sp. S45 TaxID=1641861 RepID=UPI00157644EF|nr:glycoside hydrolase family 16 protein [Caulobacter sp. S45]
MKALAGIIGLTICAFNSAVAEPLPGVIVPETLGSPTFQETFRTLDAGPDLGPSSPGRHRWRTILKNSDPDHAKDARSLSTNTWFGDQSDGAGSSPFALTSRGLVITATRQAQPSGRSWRSGVLTTKFSFSQMYGYFEFFADLPACVKAAWPGLWLMPEKAGWPRGGEIDAPETIGDGKVYWTAISGATGGKTQRQITSAADCTRTLHRYGVLWRPDRIGYYYDRHLVGGAPTPPDYDSPMYLLIDLNVGGGWPGQPDPALRQVSMTIDHVAAWPLKAP